MVCHTPQVEDDLYFANSYMVNHNLTWYGVSLDNFITSDYPHVHPLPYTNDYPYPNDHSYIMFNPQ